MLKTPYTLDEIMTLSPVMPVIAIDDAAEAVNLARALMEGGIRVLEVTLRTPAALEAIRRIGREVEGAVVGAGTVLNPDDLRRVRDAGAAFAISPGITPELLRETAKTDFPFLPGVATASEIMQGLDTGLERFKLFPASSAGGVSALRSFAGPFPRVKFCPTGGIGASDFTEYLALENVLCVGGSWVAPSGLIRSRAYGEITALSRAAVDAASGLRRTPE
jgi:2-dehydro-3-deoxyphosphogluconate aldolase/(4S)-4-hydroxy-2-oxoglutarate aldolase